VVSDIEEVTLTCPEADCDVTVTGPATGSGSAAWKMGTHRARKHNYRNPAKVGRPKKPPSTPRGRDDGASVTDVIRDAAAEVSDKSTKPPTIPELTSALSRFVGTVSVAEASYFAETDGTITTEEDRDAVVDYLRLSPTDAREVAYPFARAFGRTRLNARYGRALVDNIDAGSAAAALFQLGVKHRRYFRERRRREELLGLRPQPPQLVAPAPAAAPGPPQPAQAQPPAPPFPAPATGEHVGFAPPGGTTEPGEMRGIVAAGPTMEDVRAAMDRAGTNGHASAEVPGA
jgi:hypothetical protein